MAGFLAASVWSMRIGCADYWLRQETVRGTEKAIALTPGQAVLYARLALLESTGDEQKAMESLRHAIDLNPSDASSWIELGLRQEAAGDYGLAEQDLLRAAAVDKEYLPRWTLANYYLRRDDTASFWIWAKASAAILTGDPMLLFQLCGRVAEDGSLIERLQIRRPEVRAAYLSYLLDQSRVDLLQSSVQCLMEQNRESDVPLLERACNRLLEAKHVDQAIEIWNRLAKARRIPFGSLPGAGGTAVTNGDFSVPPTSRGFDWRLPVRGGVSASSEENPSGLRVTFSGSEGESGESLFQFVPVQENTEYELVLRYRTSEIPPGAGPRWKIADRSGTLLKEGAPLSSETETQGQLSVVTPRGCRLLRLSLSYERMPGTTRIEGFVMLRSVELRASPSSK